MKTGITITSEDIGFLNKTYQGRAEVLFVESGKSFIPITLKTITGEGFAEMRMVEVRKIQEIKQPNETMIECTLQEAIELCHEHGGIFYEKGSHEKLHVNEIGIALFKDGENLDQCVEYFKKIWIYEPPKKSEFQKWIDSKTKVLILPIEDDLKRTGRKEGWNAAIDSILGNSQICLTPSESSKIKALKEGE